MKGISFVRITRAEFCVAEGSGIATSGFRKQGSEDS